MPIEQEIKKHPYVTGGLVLAGGIVLILVLRSQSSGTSSGSDSGVGSVAAAQEQENQLEAAASVQNNQTAAAQQAAQLQAEALNNQTIAAQNTSNNQTDAALIAALAQNQTQAQANSLSAEVTDNQYSTEANVQNTETNDELSALTNTNQTQLDALNTQTAAGVAVDQLQAGLQSQALSESSTLEGNDLSDEQSDEQTVLSGLINGAPGLNRNDTQLSDILAAIEGTEGNAGVGVAIAGSGTAETVAGDQEFSTIVNSLSNFGKTLVNSL
jgi:hypothetical protein